MKIVLFDFDGVLQDSVEVKTNAFVDLYKGKATDNQLEQIKNYHLQHGGISRVQKIKFFEENILNNVIDDEVLSQRIENFKTIIWGKVKEAPLFSGVISLLHALKEKGCKMFIVSGAPRDEIWDILVRNKIEHYFEAIYDGRTSKEKHILEILSILNASKKEVIFLGDSETDIEASKECGIPFVAVNPSFAKDKYEALRFKNIDELLGRVDDLLAILNQESLP